MAHVKFIRAALFRMRGVTMGYQKYLAEMWKKPFEGVHGELMKERLMLWRKEPSIVRV